MDKMGSSQFKAGYWWVNHKLKLIKIGKIIFIIFDVVLCLICAYFIFKYFANYNINKQIEATIGINEVQFPERNPSAIQIVNTYALSSGANKVDLLAEIVNPNADWAAKSFKYSFSLPGAETVEQESFILPGQNKSLVRLGVTKDSSTTTKPKLSISEITWEKIKEPLPEINVDFKDVEYAAALLGEGATTASSLVSGSVINKGAYGYYDSQVTVVLEFSGAPVGVGQIGLTDFKSLEEKPVEIRFNTRYPFNVDIKPEFDVNILDQDNLILPGQ